MLPIAEHCGISHFFFLQQVGMAAGFCQIFRTVTKHRILFQEQKTEGLRLIEFSGEHIGCHRFKAKIGDLFQPKIHLNAVGIKCNADVLRHQLPAHAVL